MFVKVATAQDSVIEDDITSRLACQVQGDMHLYDLRDLHSTDDYELLVSPTETIHYNFCEQLSKENTADDWCLDEDTLTFAYLKDTEAEECYPLTTSSLYPTKIALENTYLP
jgi:hypothetical protein